MGSLRAVSKKSHTTGAFRREMADRAEFEPTRSFRVCAGLVVSNPRATALEVSNEILAIAAARPRSTAELLAVPGIGPGKAAGYGDAIVSLVRALTSADFQVG